jgi:hypothetical protein
MILVISASEVAKITNFSHCTGDQGLLLTSVKQAL